MNRREAGMQLLPLVLIVTLLGGGLWYLLEKRGWLAADETQSVRGAAVQRGPLRISVIERGNLKAADSISLKSEIEGSTTILKLVPEGTQVQEGELLCELDATPLIDRKFQQEISVRNAEAAVVKSRATFQIQQSQNDSDIKKADQALLFAELDKHKFEEGEKRAKEAAADEAIKLAEEEQSRADEKVLWSEKLKEKGFLTETELEADRLALSRARIQLEQKKRDQDLLVRFQLPRDQADLSSKAEEAARGKERVKLQADARIVDFEADMRTNEAKLQLEKEKLDKLVTQIGKSKLFAPRAGMVVYAVEDGGRYGGGNPIKEGTQVRERQEILTIPSASGMIAQASLHESVLKQVEPGQAVTVKVDAIPAQEFRGRVRYVSVMADQNSYWANPNLRLYRTEITIDEAIAEMRPGMSCAIEILVEEIPDALYVPVQSIFRRGNDNLAFVDKGGASEERAVQVGRYNDRWVQVLAGLAEGETVLLAPPAGFQREVQEGEAGSEAPAEAAKSGAVPVASQVPAAAPGAARPDGLAGEGRAAEARRERGEGGAFDPAKADEFKKRFEGLSEEEKAKAMEGRGRRGSDGEKRGGGPGGGG
ncbi:MAG: HlyD family efflux transporter periplasmic adaptor subunit [Planctomycetes bacterium]|nr:HlyD family efflux transporter periplasmic adaptor subunit [Planctomycetota bacterium]